MFIVIIPLGSSEMFLTFLDILLRQNVFGVVEQLQTEETAATGADDDNAERGRLRQRYSERQLQIAGGNKQNCQNWKTE